MRPWGLLLLAALAAHGQTPNEPPAASQGSAETARPAGPADVLQLELDKRLYFTLPLTLEHAPGLKPEQISYFEGMLAYHKGRLDDARKDLIAAVNTSGSVLTSNQAESALETLGETARMTFQYGACAQMYQDILNIWGAKLGTDAEEIKQKRHLCVAQMPIAAQTVDFTKPFTIRGRNGVFPVRVGDKEFDAALDTGSSVSLISESTAKLWGVTASDTTVVLHGYSGGMFRAHVGAVAQISIGTATLHNVVVFIAPDSEFSVGPAALQIPSLLGYPVLSALGRMTFTRDGSLTASPTSPPDAAKDGVPLWLGDALLLVQLGTLPPTGRSFRFGGEHEPRLFVLDTGSRDSYLTDHYFDEHREAFQGPPPETAKLAGAGGEQDTPAYSADHLPLWGGAAEVLLSGPHVLTAPQSSAMQNYEGLLGQSVLDGLRSYTIDLRTMRFSMEP